MIECVQRNKVRGIIAAAAILPPWDTVNPYKTLQVNTVGITNALEIQRLMELERVVFVSTAGVYGKRSDLSPIDEDSAKNPEILYEDSKLIAEQVCRTYKIRCGVDVRMVRFAFIYGPGQRDIWPLNILLYHALEGKPFKIQEGADYPTDLCYVKDAARGAVQAYLAKQPSSLAYNIGFGRLISVAEIAAALKDIFPEFRYEIGAGLWPSEMHRAWVRGPLRIARARSDLGYSPEYDLKKGLRDFVEWLRVHPEHKSWPKNDLWIVQSGEIGVD
jgi:nucleoside-diphosphate-sugar epimerase